MAGKNSRYNQTSAPLGAGQTYTGVWESAVKYASIRVSVATDQNGTLYIDTGVDQSTSDETFSYSVTGGTPIDVQIDVQRRFYRVRFTNTSGSAQTYIRLGVVLSEDNAPVSGVISGTVSVSNFPATQAVTGPLTDAQLRASDVNVEVTNANIEVTQGTTPWASRLTDGTNNATLKSLGTQLTTSDIGLVSNTVIHGVTTGGGGGYVDVKVNPSGALTVEAEISNFPAVQPVSDNGGSLTVDGTVGVSGTVAVSAASLPLPSGAATAANQTTANASLAAIDASTDAIETKLDSLLTELGQKTEPANTQIIGDGGGSITVDGPLTDAELRASAVAVSAAALPLPTGAATAANQATANASLAAIDANTDAIETKLDSLLTELAQKTEPANTQIVGDGGGSLTVDGTIGVSGTVAVTGPLTDAELRAAAVPVSAASLPLPTGAATAANQSAANSSLSSIDTKLSGPIPVNDNGGSLTVDGTVSVSGVVDVTPASPSAADYLPVRLTDGSAFYTASGGGGGGSTQYTEDAASAGGESLTLAGAVRQDSPSSSTSADGDYTNLKTDSSGRLWVNNSGVTQPISQSFETSGSGSIATNGATVIASTSGFSALGIVISGTWSGVMQLEGSVDGSTWEPVYGRFPSLAGAYTTWTSNGTMQIPAGGFTQIRLRASSWTSGTANIAWRATMGDGAVQVFNLRPNDLRAGIEGLEASGAAATVFPIRTASKYNATLPTFSDGNAADLQADAKGRLVVTERPPRTYRAVSAAFTAANTATDFFTLTGSASATVYITKLIITATQTTAGTNNIFLLKRSTANSGGTSSTLTAVPMDSNSAAATATARSYTANPTTGTLVGNIEGRRVLIPAATTAAVIVHEIEFGENAAQPVVLRGTGQVFAVNLNSVTVTGNSFIITIEWTEE